MSRFMPGSSANLTVGLLHVCPLLRHDSGRLHRSSDQKKGIEANTGSENQTKAQSGDTMPARIVHPANGKAHSEHTPGWR